MCGVVWFLFRSCLPSPGGFECFLISSWNAPLFFHSLASLISSFLVASLPLHRVSPSPGQLGGRLGWAAVPTCTPGSSHDLFWWSFSSVSFISLQTLSPSPQGPATDIVRGGGRRVSDSGHPGPSLFLVYLSALSTYRLNSRLHVFLPFFFSPLLPFSCPALRKLFTVSVLSWRRS